MNCTEVHLQIGAEPQASTPELEAHLRECVACADYRREMRELDEQILRALQIDLAALESDAPADAVPGDVLKNEAAAQPAARLAPRPLPPPENSSWAASMARQWALAASVLFAVGVVLFLWGALPRHSLAADVVAHVIGEPLPPGDAVVPPAALQAILQNAHLRLDPLDHDVLFAQTCFFRGRLVPHFVVRSRGAAVTVLVLQHESVHAPEHFADGGYRGVLLPNAGHGSIAVLSRANIDSEQEAREILSALHLQPAA